MRILVAAALLVGCGDNIGEPAVLPEETDTVSRVDPRIGTGGLGFGHGSCFVGATMPHGLVKLGPDTNGGTFGTVNFLHYSGYFAEDDRIQGFSHLHLHGTGATDYGVLSVMPIVAFDPSKLTVQKNEAKFLKEDEHATVGRYDVTFVNGIRASLSATERVGVHRYTGAGAILIDLAKVLSGGEIDAASLTVDATANEITGQLHHEGGMSGGFGGYTVYFVAKTSAPWTTHRVWSAGSSPSSATTASGTDVGIAIDVGDDIQLAVAVSFVSLDGARANLAAESPTIDIDATVASARAAWAALLDRVLVTGGTEAERRIFYTSLYHAYLMPTLIGDVDGSYVLAGMSAPVVAQGYRQMSDLSLWDTYRTVGPLYAWLAPDSARDQSRSLVGFGEGIGIYPRWPVATGESGTMLGSSAEIIIADAVKRGVPNAGGEMAWDFLRAAAMDTVAPRGTREAVQEYLTLHYVPLSRGRSASTTTEYSHDDYALAQLADALGHTSIRDELMERRKGWRKLYDPSVGFLRGRNADGTFPSGPFDPLEMTDEFAEANAWHSLWMAGAHDPEGLVAMMGSKDAAITKLEEFFDNAKIDLETADDSAINFPRPYYWHGNEPDVNAPFLFTQLGERSLSDKWQKWVADTQYNDQPNGVAGNDDGGTLGAWYVLQALGVYPIPGGDRWIIAAPRFPQARVRVGGKELVITAEGVSERAIYVTSVTLDGVAIEPTEITHAQLANASTLHFVMGED
jgi:predicted alpha-1,2-mannosidase